MELISELTPLGSYALRPEVLKGSCGCNYLQFKMKGQEKGAVSLYAKVQVGLNKPKSSILESLQEIRLHRASYSQGKCIVFSREVHRILVLLCHNERTRSLSYIIDSPEVEQAAPNTAVAIHYSNAPLKQSYRSGIVLKARPYEFNGATLMNTRVSAYRLTRRRGVPSHPSSRYTPNTFERVVQRNL